MTHQAAATPEPNVFDRAIDVDRQPGTLDDAVWVDGRLMLVDRKTRGRDG